MREALLLQRLPAFLQHRKLRQEQLALPVQIILQRRLVGKALQQRPSIILGKRGDFRIDGVDARAPYQQRRNRARGCLQFKSPSPAGRSPQRGRDGEGVDNAAYEMKFRFFNRLLPSPQPLSHRERG